MKKFLTTRFLLFFLLGIALFHTGNASVEATVVEPDFATLPIDETLITTVGQAGSPQGSDGYNYVQINDGVTSNISGGVWFNKAVSFTRSFRLEMAFCIENAAADSDGLAFVMQSSGLNALAQQASSTIGVWSNTGGTDPLNTGAIPQSFAIEFDTFYNSGSFGVHGAMDRDAPNSHHIAWNFPGSNEAYTTEGWLPTYKVVNHLDPVAVTKISDSQWHTFTVTFDQPNQTLHYSVPDFGVDVTVPVDDTFKTNVNLTNNAPVYFGFTGANGGNVQEKAVAFIDVEGLVDMELRTGVFERDPNKLLLDTETALSQPPVVDAQKTITYATYLSYKDTSDLTELEAGIKLRSFLPEGFSLVDETVYFGGPDLMVNGMPEGGTPIDFSVEAGELVATLPALAKGNDYLIHYSITYTGAPLNENLNQTVPVQTTFQGNAFVSSLVSGSPETHSYTMTGVFPPTLTTGVPTLAEAKETQQIVRENRLCFTPITIDDRNSTQARLYVTDFFTEAETVTEADFLETAQIERATLADPFTYTLERDTANLEPGTTYYLAAFVIDAEGNQSETHYYGIDFRGSVQFLSAPESINGPTINVNELARSIRSDGFAYLPVSFDQTSALLSISNSSEGTWQLSGQMTDFLQDQQQLAKDVQFVIYDPLDDHLVATVTKEETILFQQLPDGEADLTLALNEYDCYLRFVPDFDLIQPGTYTGTVNWQLESTIVDE